MDFFCDDADLILDATAAMGMGLWMGMWAVANHTSYNKERAKFLRILGDTSYNLTIVLSIHVSSKSIYWGKITINDVQELITAAGWEKVPVTVADIVVTILGTHLSLQ